MRFGMECGGLPSIVEAETLKLHWNEEETIRNTLVLASKKVRPQLRLDSA